jgi:hypothetical protein
MQKQIAETLAKAFDELSDFDSDLVAYGAIIMVVKAMGVDPKTSEAEQLVTTFVEGLQQLADSAQCDCSESATPSGGHLKAEAELEDARRDRARRDLNELLSQGCDPHEACCMVIYDILHVDADVVAGDYVDSFIDWVFERDATERDRWRAMVGTDINGVQETPDFKKEGF